MTNKEIYFPEDIWNKIKDFMPTWKNNHKRKLDLSLRLRIPPNKYKKGFWGYRTFVGIKSIYPKKLLWENYCMKTQLYTIAFRVPHRHQQEIRISNIYDEPEWFNDNLHLHHLNPQERVRLRRQRGNHDRLAARNASRAAVRASDNL